MKFFSGFCLCNEKELFKEYLEENEFVVAGFSKGAQEAIEYALNASHRIDKIQLFSPAIFDYNQKLIDFNLLKFEKNKELYIKNFLTKAGFYNKKFICSCSKEDLIKLFTFDWEKIKLLNSIKIEVFLGEYDKIIALKKALEFFKEYDIYFIKKANHFLRRQVG
jgi:hypothetical protein